jgi:hypothetical protein
MKTLQRLLLWAGVFMLFGGCTASTESPTVASCHTGIWGENASACGGPYDPAGIANETKLTLKPDGTGEIRIPACPIAAPQQPTAFSVIFTYTVSNNTLTFTVQSAKTYYKDGTLRLDMTPNSKEWNSIVGQMMGGNTGNTPVMCSATSLSLPKLPMASWVKRQTL